MGWFPSAEKYTFVSVTASQGTWGVGNVCVCVCVGGGGREAEGKQNEREPVALASLSTTCYEIHS